MFKMKKCTHNSNLYDQVEVMTAEDSDDDMEDVEEGIPMQGEDGQHYVVLEVRLPGSDTIL